MSHSTEFQPELFTDYDKDPSYDDDFRYSTTSSSDDHLDDHTYDYINPEELKNRDSFSIRKEILEKKRHPYSKESGGELKF